LGQGDKDATKKHTPENRKLYTNDQTFGTCATQSDKSQQKGEQIDACRISPKAVGLKKKSTDTTGTTKMEPKSF